MITLRSNYYIVKQHFLPPSHPLLTASVTMHASVDSASAHGCIGSISFCIAVPKGRFCTQQCVSTKEEVRHHYTPSSKHQHYSPMPAAWIQYSAF
eukprot:11823463-Ditylum_brightwellii.AAC.1